MNELTASMWERLVAFATDITGRRAAAEDVVQDVLLRFWQERSRWTPSEQLYGFLYRSVRNAALNRRRDRMNQGRLLARFAGWQRTPAQPDEVLRGLRLADEVEEAVRALPSRRREVFLLSRYHGLSYREIAEALEISPQTVANQLSAALDQLRSSLAPRPSPRTNRGPPPSR